MPKQVNKIKITGLWKPMGKIVIRRTSTPIIKSQPKKKKKG